MATIASDFPDDLVAKLERVDYAKLTTAKLATLLGQLKTYLRASVPMRSGEVNARTCDTSVPQDVLNVFSAINFSALGSLKRATLLGGLDMMFRAKRLPLR